MDKIRLLSSNVPNHLKEAVTILLKGENFELEDMLPIPLHAIQETADDCLALAISVENKFIAVMSLTAELLEACVNTKGSYEQKYKEVEIALEVAAENKRTAEEQKELSKKAYSEMERSVKEAERAYKESMESMPSGWDLVGMNAVESITSAFSSALSGVCSVATAKIRSRTTREDCDYQDTLAKQLKTESIEAYKTCAFLKPFTDTLVGICTENGKLRNDLKKHEKDFMRIKQNYANASKELKQKKKNPELDQVKDMTDKGIKLFEHLIATTKAMKVDDELVSKLAKDILDLQENITMFDAEGKMRLGGSPTDTVGPNQKQMTLLSSNDGSAAKQAVENARFKIQQSSAQLDHSREKYDKACDKLMADSEKLGKIMADIAKLDIQKVDFETIKSTLSKGIRALGELREQWGKIVRFFQMMSNLIKCSLNTSLKGFLEYAKVSQKSSLEGFPITSLKKDMIYMQAFQAAKIAYVVNMIAGSYVEISNAHLMDRIAGLGKLLGYDPEKEVRELLIEREKLQNGLQQAQASIRELVKKRKTEFETKVATRVRKIKSELENALPPPPPSDRTEERSQKTIQKVMEKVKVAEQDEPEKGLNVDDLI